MKTIRRRPDVGGHWQVVEEIVRTGKVCLDADDDGDSPLSIAREVGYYGIISLLEPFENATSKSNPSSEEGTGNGKEHEVVNGTQGEHNDEIGKSPSKEEQRSPGDEKVEDRKNELVGEVE